MASRILVVEDDEKSRRLLTDVLRWHGYDVAAVETGELGLAEAGARPPDAALLDISLPGISGLELLAALRANGLPPFPAVAVTASVMDEDRRRMLAAGFDAYVGKPVNIRELIATLQRLLDEARP